ncbi:MAG: AEC family transporter [Clostridia bacterium]|nr:AEC family transporter [Clostridia bacterium]
MVQIAFTNVLITLLYIIPGFLLHKAKKASEDHLATLSAILIYICAPCMILSSFLSMEFSWKLIQNLSLYFVLSLAAQAGFMLLMYLAFKKRMHESKYRIITIGSVLGNVGFFGLPIVKVLFPESPEVMGYSCVNMVTMNILVFTFGIYCLTGDKKYMSLKPAFYNPTMFSLIAALVIFLFGIGKFFPAPLTNGLQLIGNMTTPLCMFILGIRLSSVSFKKLFTRPFVYMTCIGKLIVFPFFTFLLTYFLPIEAPMRASLVILSAVPCASILLNMAEMYRSETEASANCVLLSTLICFMTVPLYAMLLQ